MITWNEARIGAIHGSPPGCFIDAFCRYSLPPPRDPCVRQTAVHRPARWRLCGRLIICTDRLTQSPKCVGEVEPVRCHVDQQVVRQGLILAARFEQPELGAHAAEPGSL